MACKTGIRRRIVWQRCRCNLAVDSGKAAAGTAISAASAGNIPYILGGYSLAGLFSLWVAYQTDVFAAVAACSPSVWMDGWAEYAALYRPKTPHIYLSLGTKEHKTRNPLLRTVKERITEQEELLRQGGVDTVLEWNAGNHFQENAARTAKGFLWCIKQVEEC